MGCGACRRRRYPWTSIVRLARHEGDLRDWVHEIKFHAWDAMGVELGRRLGAALDGSDLRADAIVPVPASAWRRWRRGTDHTRAIATGVASVLRLPVVRAMKRQSRRPPQRAVPPSRRRENVRGAFRVRRLAPLKGCSVILVDDVTTTRATLLEACNTLRRTAGVDEVVCAVLTVAEAGRR
jgi:predicted amidophosphoribosyltransferase